MKDYELTNVTQEPEDYRGGLIYRQEHGYKMVTMTVGVASNEQSSITTHFHNYPVSEDVEHLQGVDLYHFPVTDGTRIQLTLETPTGRQEAWYTIHPDEIIAESSSLDLDIQRSRESLPLDSAYTQEAQHEALTHYADQIPHWLDQTPRSEPIHELGNFGR